jgi:GNAT superfamily N-acetyltransferase
MIRIIKATAADSTLIAAIGAQSFIESHGHSAAPADIAAYVQEKYAEAVIHAELEEECNIFHILYQDHQAAGYSKIIPDAPHPVILQAHVTKLERLYLLRPFYGQHLGDLLFDHNLEWSKSLGQSGMWLNVWTENERAVAFYQKKGFKITGSYEFPITATHANPNHHMLLLY